jgi:plastocyanin
VRALIPLVLVCAGLVAVPAAQAKTVVKGSVGPELTITLKTAAGKPVTTLKAGEYVFVINDKSAAHMFHLIGPGINKELTNLGFQGTRKVPVTLKPGKYIYQCDPHKDDMKSSFKVTR